MECGEEPHHAEVAEAVGEVEAHVTARHSIGDDLQDVVLLFGIFPERNESRLHVPADDASHGRNHLIK